MAIPDPTGLTARDPFGGVWMVLHRRHTDTWWLSYQAANGAQDFRALTIKEGPGIPAHRTLAWAWLAQFADALSALVAAVEQATPPPASES